MVVVVPDRYDFKFSLTTAERKRRTEDSTHIQEIELIGNRKVPKSSQSHLENPNNKTNLVKYLFQKLREKLPHVLTSFQIIYLANLDGPTDRVTSQSSERINVYCDHKEADTKMIIFVLTRLPLFCQKMELR